MERRSHGGQAPDDALDFSASLNPLGPPEGVRRVLQEKLDLTDYPYDDRSALREALAATSGLSPENTLVGAGTSGLIQLLLQALSGSRLSVLVPTFTEFEDLGRAHGWSVTTQEYFSPRDAGGSIQTEEFARSDAVVLCNPNNPTGTLIEPDTLRRWLEISEKSETQIIVDEAYMPFVENPENHTLLDRIEENESLIVLRSLTKFYGIPGLRVGYLGANSGTVRTLRSKQHPWPVGEPALRGARQCLRSESFASRAREFLNAERKRVVERLKEIPNLSVVPAEANFVLCHSTVDDLPGRLRERSLYVRDASTFTGLGSGWFRLSLLDRSDNDQLLDVLKSLHEDPACV